MSVRIEKRAYERARRPSCVYLSVCDGMSAHSVVLACFSIRLRGRTRRLRLRVKAPRPEHSRVGAWRRRGTLESASQRATARDGGRRRAILRVCALLCFALQILTTAAALNSIDLAERSSCTEQSESSPVEATPDAT
eukprot:6191467-Pleurochrysis_carterae.AAC.1